ncbi:MAG: hypothetical protein ACFFCW_11530 [Candidatus Hodarchaeota archaeon]
MDPETEKPFLSEEKLHSLGGKEPPIILSHSPLAFDRLDKDDNVLMLSGDTHGGQILLPSYSYI